MKIICLILVTIAVSCNSQEIDEKKIRDDLKNNSGIITPNFILVESESESAIGDFSESFTIKFDSLDFQNVVSQIKNSKYYDSSNITLMNTSVSKRWVKMPFGYKFEYFIAGSDNWLQYEVGTSDFTITYLYVEE